MEKRLQNDCMRNISNMKNLYLRLIKIINVIHMVVVGEGKVMGKFLGNYCLMGYVLISYRL